MRTIKFCTLAIFLVASLAQGSGAPDIQYPEFAPAGSAVGTCWATANPLIIDPSSIWAGFTCMSSAGVHTSKISHMDLNRLNSGLKWTVPGAIFRDTPLQVSSTKVVAYTRDTTKSTIALLDSMSAAPIWTKDRYNSTSGVAYSSHLRLLFVPIGVHVGGTGRFAGKMSSVRAIYDKNGSTKWEFGLPPQSNITTPILTDQLLLFMHGDTLRGLEAASGRNDPIQGVMNNPCNMYSDPENPLQMEYLQFGRDANGPLRALMIYGKTLDANKNQANFTVCHAHHGHYRFGEVEWVHHAPYNNFVHKITGGGGLIFINAYDPSEGYKVVVFNATVAAGQDPFVAVIMRSSRDKASYPQVMTDPEGKNSVAVMQVNGTLTGFACTPGFKQIWQVPGVECAQQPTVVSASIGDNRAICVGYGQGTTVTHIDYAGSILWQYNYKTSFPAQVYAASNVFLQGAIDIIGLSFQPSVTAPPSPSGSSSSPGVVVLVIFLIIFVAILGAAVFKTMKGRVARRTASRAQIDKEGYAGLNQ